MEETHEQRAEGKHDERGNHGRHDHLPAYGALRLGIEMLGLFEERHQRNLGAHADKQEQKQLGDQRDIDDREIH